METRHQIRQQKEEVENKQRRKQEKKRAEKLFQRQDNVIRRNDLITDPVLRKIKVEKDSGDKEVVKVKVEQDCEDSVGQKVVKVEFEEMEGVKVKVKQEEGLGIQINNEKKRGKKSVRRDDWVTDSPLQKMIKVERDCEEVVKVKLEAMEGGDEEKQEEMRISITSSFSLKGEKTESDPRAAGETENASRQASSSSHGDVNASDLATERETIGSTTLPSDQLIPKSGLDYKALKRSYKTLMAQLVEKEKILAAQRQKTSKLDSDIGALRGMVKKLTEMSKGEDFVIKELWCRIQNLEREKKNLKTLTNRVKSEMSGLEMRIAEIKSEMDTKKDYKGKMMKRLCSIFDSYSPEDNETSDGPKIVWETEGTRKYEGFDEPSLLIKAPANGQRFFPKNGDKFSIMNRGTERRELDRIIGHKFDENDEIRFTCRWKPRRVASNFSEEEAKAIMLSDTTGNCSDSDSDSLA